MLCIEDWVALIIEDWWPLAGKKGLLQEVGLIEIST
jgi:hypothetical protein